MQQWKQYGALGVLLAGCLALGLWGFRATGGALPYANRFSLALQRGTQDGGGALVDLARGVVVAGPIRKGGLVTEYVVVVGLFVLFGAALYVYVDRGHDQDQQADQEDPA